MSDYGHIKGLGEVMLRDFGRTVRVTNILHDETGMLRSFRLEHRGDSLVWIGIGDKKEICIHANTTTIRFLD